MKHQPDPASSGARLPDQRTQSVTPRAYPSASPERRAKVVSAFRRRCGGTGAAGHANPGRRELRGTRNLQCSFSFPLIPSDPLPVAVECVCPVDSVCCDVLTFAVERGEVSRVHRASGSEESWGGEDPSQGMEAESVTVIGSAPGLRKRPPARRRRGPGEWLPDRRGARREHAVFHGRFPSETVCVVQAETEDFSRTRSRTESASAAETCPYSSTVAIRSLGESRKKRR